MDIAPCVTANMLPLHVLGQTQAPARKFTECHQLLPVVPGGAIKQDLPGEQVAIKWVAPLRGAAKHKVCFAHEVQKCQPLLVLPSPPCSREGKVPWDPRASALLSRRELKLTWGSLRRAL